MPVLVDLEARRIAASVTDLLEEPGQRRIGLQGAGRARTWLGQRLHARLQEELAAAEPDFTAEVPVRRVLEVDGWELEIHGRADGVVERDGTVERVDEIKTLHFATELFATPDRSRMERFRQQARLYAHLLARGTVRPAARLLLVDIATGGIREEDVPWSPDSVRSWLRTTVHRLVESERRRLAGLARAREIAADLPFPHPRPRPQQLEIMAAVEEALEAGRPLLLQAATGSGKTAAVLHPALRHALAQGRRLVWVTFTTSQQRMAVATLAVLGDRVRALQLRAKAKMCAHREMICHEQVCPYAEDYGGKLLESSILEELASGPGMIEPDAVFEPAVAAQVCPFELSLDLLPTVHAVVCDANYVFDPFIGLEAVLGGGSLENAVLVVDEAHNLVSRARQLYSPELSDAALDAALVHLERLGTPRAAPLTACLEEIRAWLGRTAEPALEQPAPSEAIVTLDLSPIGDLRLQLDAAMLEYVLFKREAELWLAEDPAVEAFSAVSRFASIADLGGEELVPLARTNPDESVLLRLVCLDASRFTGEVFERASGAVAMSATLSPFHYYTDMLGLSPLGPATLALPSPFPPENRLVLAIPEVDTTYRRRRQSIQAAADWVDRLAAPDRNVLVLLPSYAYLRMLEDHLAPRRHRLLVQAPGAGERERREILEALREAGGHLLLAVMGGLYAEGVDYPGEMLSQVMVVSPGLPQVSTERRLLQEFLAERYGHGFEYAYLVPGMTRVIQAAGRLIRSEEDRGVIVLIGRRFLRPPYCRLLPEEWTGGDPSSLVVEDPAAAVRSFFS